MPFVRVLMYTMAVFILAFYFIIEFCFADFSTRDVFRIIILGLSCLFMYFGGVFLSKDKNSKVPLRVNLYIFFGLYLMLLFTLTFFDKSWGRYGGRIYYFSIDNLKSYLSVACNLVPFKTIMTYVNQFDSMYSTRQIFFNLFGNIFALMPCAFFLRVLFKKQNNFKTFLITMILIILGIETIQLLTATGRFDVDDLILNLFGAIIVYFIMNIKQVKDLIDNIFLLNKNKLSRKSLTYLSICFFVFCLSFLALISYRNRLYDKNMQAQFYRYNSPLKLVTEDDSCSYDKNLFYEDTIYKYYLKCLDSKNVYILVNNKDKYLVGDLLKDDSKYSVSINRILSLFDIEKVEYEKEPKYDKISLSYDKQLTDDISIKNQDILKVKHGTYHISENGKIDVDLFLVPLKAGKTTLKIDFVNEVDKKIKYSTSYNITVDNDLNASYQEIK